MRAKIGDRYGLEELLARDWQQGGERSGHLLALDRHTTGDGSDWKSNALLADAADARGCCERELSAPQLLPVDPNRPIQLKATHFFGGISTLSMM